MVVEINKDILFPYLIYNKEVKYNDSITLYPIKMKNIIEFQQYQIALTLRKDAIFMNKEIIKMGYWDFIKFAFRNDELANEYNMPLLPFYYDFVLGLLQLTCGDNVDIKYNSSTLDISIFPLKSFICTYSPFVFNSYNVKSVGISVEAES